MEDIVNLIFVSSIFLLVLVVYIDYSKDYLFNKKSKFNYSFNKNNKYDSNEFSNYKDPIDSYQSSYDTDEILNNKNALYEVKDKIFSLIDENEFIVEIDNKIPITSKEKNNQNHKEIKDKILNIKNQMESLFNLTMISSEREIKAKFKQIDAKIKEKNDLKSMQGWEKDDITEKKKIELNSLLKELNLID